MVKKHLRENSLSSSNCSFSHEEWSFKNRSKKCSTEAEPFPVDVPKWWKRWRFSNESLSPEFSTGNVESTYENPDKIILLRGSKFFAKGSKMMWKTFPKKTFLLKMVFYPWRLHFRKSRWNVFIKNVEEITSIVQKRWNFTSCSNEIFFLQVFRWTRSM